MGLKREYLKPGNLREAFGMTSQPILYSFMAHFHLLIKGLFDLLNSNTLVIKIKLVDPFDN